MNERFQERMQNRDVAKDTRLLGDFSVIYCNGVHGDRARQPLESAGVECGVYGRKIPVICDECAALLRYAEKRRALCPRDPKPFCSYCDTHCYRETEREAMREVMKYAGPRSIVRGHAIDSVKHLIEGRKAARAAASDTDRQREDYNQ